MGKEVSVILPLVGNGFGAIRAVPVDEKNDTLRMSTRK